MIIFNKLSQELPYLKFKMCYENALKLNQKNIEAISISSFSKSTEEVNSRFVNLKFINNNEFIFFSNYESPKSQQFNEHSQISALIFWHKTNTQIRLKAKIKKTSLKFNNKYFKNRSKEKNALAISSNQSLPIESFEDVLKNYNRTIKTSNLKICPDYWGGFSFAPYYFEFWEGNKSRLNKRLVYQINDKHWEQFIIQP